MTISKPYMYRQLPIFLLVTAFAFAASAQAVYNKTYIEDRPLMLFSSVIADTSGYYVTGVTFDKGGANDLQRILICKLDEGGNMELYKTVYDSMPKNFAAFHNSLIKNSDGGFVVAGYSGDTLPRMLISKFDAAIDTAYVDEYYIPNTYMIAGMDIVQYNDSTYYVAGVKTDASPSNVNAILIKINSFGNKEWEKFYGGNLSEYAKSLIRLKNGNMMLGAFRYDGDQTDEQANTWLLEVDTAGNLIREWFDPVDSTYAAEGLLQTADGGFIYGAQIKGRQNVNSVSYKSSIVKLDSAFNKQWIFIDTSVTAYSGIFDIELTSDGDYIACGNKRYGSNVLGGWIIKLSPSGEVLWNRTYVAGSNWPLNFLSDIDMLEDGSLIAVGQCQNLNQSPVQVGWILKLDSNGCEIENCAVGIEDIEPKAEINIHPNPTNDVINIGVKNAVLHNATITISNPIGQILKQYNGIELSSSYRIDLGGYAKGLYLVAIEAEGSKIVKQVVKE